MNFISHWFYHLAKNKKLPIELLIMTQFIEFNNVLTNFGGDEDLLQSTISLSIKHFPKYLSDIQNAITNKNAKALEISAHTLKGSLSIYLYKPIVQSALELELMGREGKLEGAQEKLDQLITQTNLFIEELKSYNQTNN